LARTAFVTGASGFVGANVVRALLAEGWTVRALVRGDALSLEGLPIERVAGDLFAPSLADAMTGCDALFHLAACYSLWHRDREEVARTNVVGTRNVFAAARRAGVPRAVHTSSVAAIGVRSDGTPADETHQSSRDALVGAYKRSKYDAELEARAAIAAGLDVVIVNPTTPIGAWDAKPTPTGEIIVRFLSGRMPAYVDTGLNVVDVEEVAAGHLAAYARGTTGERYILGNENLSLRNLLERLSALTGLPAPSLRLPRLVPLAYAALGEFVFARAGYRPDVAYEGVRMAKQMMYYDATKATRALAVPHRPLAPALSRAVAWFQQHGYAPSAALPEDTWRSLSSKS
jgi:dihydroflavonol-4-reductase